MRWTILASTRTAVVAYLALSVAHGQAPKPRPEQKSPEVPLQQRVAALEKEGLKAELAALRAQIQRSGSTQTPVTSGSGSRPNGARPSEAEIRTCVAATEIGRDFGGVFQLEFGTTIISQGGMMELAMDAPKDTRIFPTKIHFDHYVFNLWVFRDSFGKLRCERVS
jgi:hypothetical protein